MEFPTLSPVTQYKDAQKSQYRKEYVSYSNYIPINDQTIKILASYIKLDLICQHHHIILSCLMVPFTHTLPSALQRPSFTLGCTTCREADASSKPLGTKQHTKPQQHHRMATLYVISEEVREHSF